MIARVTLEIALRKEFDYAIPPELAAPFNSSSSQRKRMTSHCIVTHHWWMT